MQIVPYAVGQYNDTVVFWQDNLSIGSFWTEPTTTVAVVDWDLGRSQVHQEDCLILNLYVAEGAPRGQLYLPEHLPTTSGEAIPVWRLLCEWRPKRIKVRYGRTPFDRSKERTLVLPTANGEDLIDKLQTFHRLATGKSNNGADGGGGRAEGGGVGLTAPGADEDTGGGHKGTSGADGAMGARGAGGGERADGTTAASGTTGGWNADAYMELLERLELSLKYVVEGSDRETTG